MFNSIVLLGTIFLLVSNVWSYLDSDNSHIPYTVDFPRQYYSSNTKLPLTLDKINHNDHNLWGSNDFDKDDRIVQISVPNSGFEQAYNPGYWSDTKQMNIPYRGFIQTDNFDKHVTYPGRWSIPEQMNIPDREILLPDNFDKHVKHPGSWSALYPIKIPDSEFIHRGDNKDRYPQILQDNSDSSFEEDFLNKYKDLSSMKRPIPNLESVLDPSKLNQIYQHNRFEYPIGWSGINHIPDVQFIYKADNEDKNQEPLQIWPPPHQSNPSDKPHLALTINFIDSGGSTENENKPKSFGVDNSFWSNVYKQLINMLQPTNVNENKPSNNPKPSDNPQTTIEKWISKLQPSLVDIEESNTILPSTPFESTLPKFNPVDMGKLIIKLFKYFFHRKNNKPETLPQQRSTNIQNLSQENLNIFDYIQQMWQLVKQLLLGENPEEPLYIFSDLLNNIINNAVIPTFAIEVNESYHRKLSFDKEKELDLFLHNSKSPHHGFHHKSDKKDMVIDNSEHIRANTPTDSKNDKTNQRTQTNNNKNTETKSNGNSDSTYNKDDTEVQNTDLEIHEETHSQNGSEESSDENDGNEDVPSEEDRGITIKNGDSQTQLDEKVEENKEGNVGNDDLPAQEDQGIAIENQDSQTELDEKVDETKLSPPVETINDENVSTKRYDHKRKNPLRNLFGKYNQKHQKYQNNSSKNLQSDQANETNQKSLNTEAQNDY